MIDGQFERSPSQNCHEAVTMLTKVIPFSTTDICYSKDRSLIAYEVRNMFSFVFGIVITAVIAIVIGTEISTELA